MSSPVPQRKHVSALILARGGSQSIPLKNTVKLCGLPLIEWNLRAAVEFQRFDSIWVSTDNVEIANIAKSVGARIHWRSPEVSTDNCLSITSVMEFLSFHEEVDVVALVQCTTPFIHPWHLDRAYQLMMEGGYDSVFSVTRTRQLRWKEVGEGESTVPLNFDPRSRVRRQEWNGELAENGAFYFAKRAILLDGLFQGGRCCYVEMPSECSVDIDDVRDCIVAEQLLPKHGYHAKDCRCNACIAKNALQ
ncbi:CMAS (predicted) [Pycnogonum litorale]